MTKNVFLMLQVLSLLFSTQLLAQALPETQTFPDDQIVVTGKINLGAFNEPKPVSLTNDLFNVNPFQSNSPFGVNTSLAQDYTLFAQQPLSLPSLNPDYRFTSAAGQATYNQATSGLLLDESDARDALKGKERIKALCDYTVETEVLGNAAQLGPACGLSMIEPLQTCGLSGAIQKDKFDQLIGQLKAKKNDSNALDLKQECFKFGLESWNSNLKILEPNKENAFSIKSELAATGWFTSAFNKKTKNIEHSNTVTKIGCPNSSSEDVSASSCNDFSNTAVSGNSIIELAKRYVLALPDFGGTFLPSLFGQNCSSCFAEKYVWLKSQKEEAKPSNEEIESQYRKQSEDKYNEYVEKKAKEKAVLAFSEYTKHLDRRNAYSTIISRSGGQSTSCSDPANLKIEIENVRKNRGTGCVSDGVLNKRMKDISNVILLGSRDPNPDKEVSGVEDFFERVEGRAQEEILNSPVPMICGVKKVPRSGYDKLRTSEFSDVYLGLIQDAMKDKASKESYGKCGSEDESCLVDVLRSYLKNNGDTMPEQSIQMNFLNNPYLRLLVKNKSGWGVVEKMKISKSVAENFEKNKLALLGLIEKDEKESCASLQKDLAQALCMKPDRAAVMMSPANMKNDFQNQVEAIRLSTKPQLDKNLETLEIMGQACHAVLKNKFDSNTVKSQFSADASADVQNYADPVLRAGMIEKMPNSAKFGDEFSNYARSICRDDEPEPLININAGKSNKPCLVINGCFAKLPGSDYLSVGDPKTNSYQSYNFNTLPGVDDYTYKPIKLQSSYFSGSSRPTMTTTDEELKQTFKDNSSPSLPSLTPGVSTKESMSGLLTQRSDKDFAATTELIKSNVESPNDKKAATTAVDGSSANGAGNGEVSGTSSLIGGATTVGVNVSGSVVGSNSVVSGTSGIDMPSTSGSQFTRTSFNSIEREEVAQTNAEKALIEQTSTLRDTRSQLELEKLRLEMEQLRSSNKTLLASLKKTQAQSTTSSENIFDSQEQDAEDQEAAVVPSKAAEGPGRKPASIATPIIAASNAGSSSVPNVKPIETIASSSAITSSIRDITPVQTAPVANFQSGLAAGGGVLIQNSGSVIGSRMRPSFVPSLSLQQSIQTSSSASEPISVEKKVELVKEFLSYVESNPEYREGRYLNSNNDQITIDYAGSVMTVKVDEIADPTLRSQLKDRLVRQRLVLNQQARKQRLESLRRLLAKARSDF